MRPIGHQLHTQDRKPSVIAGFLRSPIPKSDPPPGNREPARELGDIDQFIIGLDQERHAPGIELRAGARNPVPLHHHVGRELGRLAQLFDRGAQTGVIREGFDRLDQQPLPDLRSLLEFAGRCFNTCPEGRRRDGRPAGLVVQPQTRLAFQLLQAFRIPHGAVAALLLGNGVFFLIGRRPLIQARHPIVHDERPESLQADTVMLEH